MYDSMAIGVFADIILVIRRLLELESMCVKCFD